MSGGRKIILHIGLHKTGTTTIQNVLHANRDFLLRQEKVLYPSLSPNLSSALLAIFRTDSRQLRANKVASFTTEQIAARRTRFLNSLDTEISSREWDTLLLSAEGASHLSESEMARLREWGEKYSSEWSVLVCVRHPVDWSRSVVQERLKAGDTLAQLYKKFPTPKYHLKISRAISVFGQENLRVFDYEGAAKGDGGIVGSFAKQAGLSPSSANFLASRALRRYNESLSLEAARILDSLNRHYPLFGKKGRAPRRAGRHAGPRRELTYISRIKGQKFDVPTSVKENIRLHSREDVAWLNETFGLELYRDVMTDYFAPQGHKEGVEEGVVQEEALSDPAVDSIAKIIGELVTENALQRVLNQGREALAQGEFERAARMLGEAERLDPDAPQPKKLLEEAKLLKEGSLKGRNPKEGSGKQPGRFSRWRKP